jgi:hypothetical protein
MTRGAVDIPENHSHSAMSPSTQTLSPLFSVLIITTSKCTATRDIISSGHLFVGVDKLVSIGKFALGFFDTTGNTNTTAPSEMVPANMVQRYLKGDPAGMGGQPREPTYRRWWATLGLF